MAEVVEVIGYPVQVVEVAAVVGPRGPAGSGGVVFTQASALSTWTIPHSIGRIPAVQVYVDGHQVDTDIDATTTQVVLTFASPAAGVAVLF